MKAIYVLYQRPYESPDCYVKWLIGTPGHWACLADPGASQIMVRKYLSVGQISKFIYQQIALDVLFQMRYGSLLNSNKQPSDSQRGWGNPCFHISLVLLSPPASKTYLINFESHSVTSWSRRSYHISFERGDLELSLDIKFWNFLKTRYDLSQVQITQFQHGFGMLWGLPTSLFLLVCHSVISWSMSNFNPSFERGLKYLSYDHKYPNIH